MGRQYVRAPSAASTLLLLVLFISGCASFSAADGLKHTSKKVSVAYDQSKRMLRSPICGGPGPVCRPGHTINCEVGGDNLGCICVLLHQCQPDVSGCYLHNGNNITYCGF